jgi:ABC-type phosphate transport system substrate-binding protein
MINLRIILLTLFACAIIRAQCVPGGLAVVVQKANPTNSLSLAQLRKLVMGDVHTWPDKNKVTLVSTDSEGAVFKCVLTSVVRMSPAEYKKYVMSAEFRGDEPAHIRVVDSSATAVRTVAASGGSFSVIEASSLASLGGAVKVLSINGKQPGEPGYPL